MDSVHLHPLPGLWVRDLATKTRQPIGWSLTCRRTYVSLALHPMTTAKDTKLTAMISEEDMAKLKALSEADDVSASQVVRLLIRQAYAGRFGEKKPRRPR